jgi:hypothetical protein
MHTGPVDGDFDSKTHTSDYPCRSGCLMRFYCILVEEGLEPSLSGPYQNDQDRTNAAKAFRNKRDDNAVFWLDLDKHGNPIIGSYTEKELEP